MDRNTHILTLEKQLRAQAELLEACGRRIAAAPDPRLKSAWLGAVVRLMNASAATGSAIAYIRWAPADRPWPPHATLHLPKLPQLPEIGEGSPPPAQIRKTTSRGFSTKTRSLAFLS